MHITHKLYDLILIARRMHRNAEVDEDHEDAKLVEWAVEELRKGLSREDAEYLKSLEGPIQS
jgi:hypothetical protein